MSEKLAKPTEQQPPSPDLSKPFWTPPLPALYKNIVRREHPIPNWGDYLPASGLYIWQRPRLQTGNPGYTNKYKRALESMWYGIENIPRCDECERKDTCCTLFVSDVRRIVSCARCRLVNEKCSFAGGGRDISEGMDADTKDDTAAPAPEHQPLADRYTAATAHSNDSGVMQQPDDRSPAKRHKCSNSEWEAINQEYPDDEIPLKTVFDRRRANAEHHADIIKPHPHDTMKRAGPHNKNRRQTVIEILDSSPPPSPLFCPTAEAPELEQAHSTYVAGQQDDFSTITGAADYAQIQERLRALEAENYQHKADKRQDREQILKLEEQISVLREQDRKLEEKLRVLRNRMNYAVNQLMLHQLRKAEVGR
ncbi:hypothetical protein QM012_004685 [Aureobasidium pullulans]|uniref:Zn(2)-C6 fungal-type domain-containing protein n=1 Tax=Aureobasidium pullulans TaxID=5580 RepID=A0ABR0TUM1_AURPU